MIKFDVSAVVFDFDDTLQDRDVAFRKYADDFLKRFFKDLPSGEKQKRIDDMACRINGGYIDRFEFFKYYIDLWDWKDAPSLKSLEEDYNYYFGLFSTLFDDTNYVLDELKARGYKLGILTNGVSDLQNRKLDVCGIRDKVDAVVVSGDYNIHKPDSRIFDIMAQKLGEENGRILFVGDHPVNDIAGAESAGMQVVRIMKGVFTDQPTPGVYSINTLSELPKLLER